MPEGQVLEFSGVTKRFGAVAAVSGFSARIEPGTVTGFLGPNGAGKTTSLRILLGLVRADQGSATIGGRPYAKLKNPLATVGAVLEASSFHPGRTAAGHLKVYALAAGLPTSRVDETLATVGLADVAGRKVGGFSLGMRQRLGLAYALLGDPGVLVLDEPSNGLDPEGIKWMRVLLRELARQGRTILVSSHLLAEVQQTVDSLLIIAQGRPVFQGRLDELTDPSEYAAVVDSPDRAALASALGAAGIEYEVLRSGLTVRGMDTAVIGRAAADHGVALSSLQRRGPALEEVFLELVSGLRVHVPRQSELEAAPPAPPSDEETATDAALAGTTGAAGAAVATGLAAVAGAEHEADDAESDAATGADAAGEAVAVAEGTPPAADDDPAAWVSTDTATFAVASTGVISVVPPGAFGPEDSADDDATASEAAEVHVDADGVDADGVDAEQDDEGAGAPGSDGDVMPDAVADVPADGPGGEDDGDTAFERDIDADGDDEGDDDVTEGDELIPGEDELEGEYSADPETVAEGMAPAVGEPEFVADEIVAVPDGDAEGAIDPGTEPEPEHHHHAGPSDGGWEQPGAAIESEAAYDVWDGHVDHHEHGEPEGDAGHEHPDGHEHRDGDEHPDGHEHPDGDEHHEHHGEGEQR